MKTKLILRSLVFALIAATSSVALAQGDTIARDQGMTVRDSGPYPWSDPFTSDSAT
jgi:hypothetical protein